MSIVFKCQTLFSGVVSPPVTAFPLTTAKIISNATIRTVDSYIAAVDLKVRAYSRYE